jgi:hypothetical protein
MPLNSFLVLCLNLFLYSHPAEPAPHLLTLVLRRLAPRTAPELPAALLLTGPLIAAMEVAVPAASLQWTKGGQTRANITPSDGVRIHTETLMVLKAGWARILSDRVVDHHKKCPAGRKIVNAQCMLALTTEGDRVPPRALVEQVMRQRPVQGRVPPQLVE